MRLLTTDDIFTCNRIVLNVYNLYSYKTDIIILITKLTKLINYLLFITDSRFNNF